jgi:hypothetical protein
MTAMNSEKSLFRMLLRLLPWGLCAALMFVLVRNAAVLAPQSKEPTGLKEAANADQAQRARERAERPRKRLHTGPITEEEWKQAKEFLQQYSPNRYRRIQTLETKHAAGLKAGNFEGLKRVLVDVWLDLSVTREESPALYQTRLKEVKLEDDIFGICLEMQKVHHDKQASDHLKAKVAELFEVGLVERQQRIGLVETAIGEQKKSLVSDQANKAQLVSQRYQYVIEHGVAGARLDTKHTGQKNKNGSTTEPTTEDSESSETGAP